jgi:hypothetical protein
MFEKIKKDLAKNLAPIIEATENEIAKISLWIDQGAKDN